MKRLLAQWKVWLGIALSFFFLWLAFRKVHLGELWRSLRGVNYVWIIPALAAMFGSHWVRAFRWRFLLEPVRRIHTFPLFSALLIGYMANTFLPAHLGEFVRAYVVSKKQEIPWPQVFASIVVDRILDMLTLVMVMGLTLIVFPFPSWVKQSGAIMLVGTLLLSLLLVWLKLRQQRALILFGRLLRPLPEAWSSRLLRALGAFLDGLRPLRKGWHYPVVIGLSFLIWGGYIVSFYVFFHAFHLVSAYHLSLSAALVIQVITTISVVVPSSPGYVGTFHYLCQVSLGLFGVPADVGLGYAIVMHATTFLPVLPVGLAFLFFSGFNLKVLRQSRQEQG